jgi:hypothetical protein
VFLSAGLDMGYTDDPAMQGHSMFDNVFVDPKSWAAFKRTGHWPDKTMFAMESRGATTHAELGPKQFARLCPDDGINRRAGRGSQ